jgi:hypothetical protein
VAVVCRAFFRRHGSHAGTGGNRSSGVETFAEGKSAQILHIGPFSEEGPTIEKVHAFIVEKSFRRTGKHHEIYLSDIRRAAPEKWKTIVRQPMSQ